MSEKIYWLDIESTGLVPAADAILEIAVAEADFANPFEHKHIYQAVLQRTGYHANYLKPFIADLHTKNGLLTECVKGKRLTCVIEDLLELLPVSDSLTMAGASVHFDHAFLKVWMPDVAKRFSHRHYDVSAVKLFAQSLGMSKLPKAEAHRAAADIDESVAHAKACAAWFKWWKAEREETEYVPSEQTAKVNS